MRLGRAVRSWLGEGRLGLAVMALAVGGGAGLAAAGFRWLIFAFTWLVTGHQQFGQRGHAESLHIPSLGIWFVVIAPVAGGLLYGPLIYRFAREARGHGVPEVMLAVAENGGRIRPPVTIVKALASAMCIGVGGSVGREGPIVQIGSAFASTLGQVVRMSENGLRIVVACGAAGGIAATFNAPITGLFFGFEIVLREFSLDALFATILAAVTGDLVSHAFFGSAPFFAGIPHGMTMTNDYAYLLVAVLGVASGFIGLGFKTILYKLEDVVEELWKGRPEWALPAVGGVALGGLLLLMPELYGVGYPVMDKVIAGHVLLWLIVLLMVGKIAAASLTLSIGGSGGVFAPSLFIGAMAGMAFGIAVHHLFGPAVGSPAMYAVVGMGGVFGAAAQAPLTSIASVVEMTGNFTLTLPVMLAAGIASALSKHLSYGSVYTTKLLRRGIDIYRPKPAPAVHTEAGSAATRRVTVAVHRPTRGDPVAVDPKHTAVVLIEYQNDFTSEGGALHDAVKGVMEQTDMLENTRKLVDAARGAGATIVHAPITFAAGYGELPPTPYGILKGVVDSTAFVKGEWGAEIVDALEPQEGDVIVEGKRGLDTFATTNLDFILRARGITTIALGGFLTNCCVESTMRSGYEKGYEVITLSDCVAATSPEEHENAIRFDYPMFSAVMTSEALADQLAGAPVA